MFGKTTGRQSGQLICSVVGRRAGWCTWRGEEWDVLALARRPSSFLDFAVTIKIVIYHNATQHAGKGALVGSSCLAAYHLLPSLATASGVSMTVIRRKKDCAPPICSGNWFWNTQIGMMGAAKALAFFADKILDSDFLVFALLAGVACKRWRAINHQQHFEMNNWMESCL